jgi:hypothetical protein
MLFISFDAANKSLAISIIEYNIVDKQIENLYSDYKQFKNANSNIESILEKYNELLANVNELLENRIVFRYFDVVDLIPNRKLKETNIIERTYYLIEYLKKISIIIDHTMKTNKIVGSNKTNDLTFLIEYQMGPNDKSRVISNQILSFSIQYLLDKKLVNKENVFDRIKLLGPSLKNTLYIKNDKLSYHHYYISNYNNNYRANKEHTKYIITKLTPYFGKRYNVNLTKINKKNIDDIGDSVCLSLIHI